MNEESENYIAQLEQELVNERQRSMSMQTNQNSASVFGDLSDDNLIRWQLDLKEDLDRIYHLLKGHRIVQDKEGNIFYEDAKDDNEKPLNEFGVQLIMNIMSFYLNRNTLLSNYDDKVINQKVYDFGMELVDLIFNRYEDIGMDTPEKRKMYPMIVRELVDTVHSAYLRAFNGGERESLRTARTVTQSEPLMRAGMNYQSNNNTSKFSLIKPWTWGK